MGSVDQISDAYVDAYAALDPCAASVLGLTGHDTEITDYGPAGVAARAELDRRTLAELAGAPAAVGHDRLAARVLRDHLEASIALRDAGATEAELSPFGAISEVRRSVELLDRGADTPWETVGARLRAMPAALAGLRATIDEARGAGRVAARRQVANSAAQCDATAAYLDGLRGSYDGPGRDALDRTVAGACAAFAELAAYLRTDLAPAAPVRDALGRDRYQLGVRYWLGSRPDLEETYAWGWIELARIGREMAAVAGEIAPGESARAVIDRLDADPAHTITGRANFRAWIQELGDRAIAELDGVHFDIPEPLRTIECHIAPTNSGGIYTVPPNADFSRPGSVWWTMPTDTMTTWTVPATMYHEGVPGHHLQQGMTVYNAETLNRFQRAATELGNAGHVEGWGLYAERLMDELGYYTEPAHRFGMLALGQRMRAARVILDIGLHLELPIPEGAGFHDGERWTRELAVEFMRDHLAVADDAFVSFEVDRYLGVPGQALAYKVGERAWFAVREEARRRQGASFDLKAFHRAALDLGPMGLDAFAEEMARRTATRPNG
ncbi:MAG TPA: DUF885 domain-containing protein [Streptosporangiaceae bacterium]|jgi:uncharacterized protein (DUF885 family)